MLFQFLVESPAFNSHLSPEPGRPPGIKETKPRNRCLSRAYRRPLSQECYLPTYLPTTAHQNCDYALIPPLLFEIYCKIFFFWGGEGRGCHAATPVSTKILPPPRYTCAAKSRFARHASCAASDGLYNPAAAWLGSAVYNCLSCLF